MDRLLDINRQDSFPLCAETLQILETNSRALESWLRWLPLGTRQAVLFPDKDYIVVGTARQGNRTVKVGSISAGSLSSCKVVLNTVQRHSVTTGNGSVISDVWETQTADIVDAVASTDQWEVFSFDDVFELCLWHDDLVGFREWSIRQAQIAGTGKLMDRPVLYGDELVLQSNRHRLRFNIAISCTIDIRPDSVMTIPLLIYCPDGVRFNADIEGIWANVVKHYPIRVLIQNNEIQIDLGRFLTEELHASGALAEVIIRINGEVVL